VTAEKVVFTVLTKDYDELRQPESIRRDFDYICFCNDFTETNIGIWQIRPIPYENSEPVRMCRYVKLLPHRLLPEYKYSLWLDCNQRLTEELYRRFDKCIADNSRCAMVLHPERDCTYQEAYVLIGGLVDRPEIIYRQTEYLLRNNFPPRCGLFVTCCIFREHNNRGIVDFDELWWQLLDEFSFRDQMSVMFALRATGIRPAIFYGRDFWQKFRLDHTKTVQNYSIVEKIYRRFRSKIWIIKLAGLLRKNSIYDFLNKDVEL